MAALFVLAPPLTLNPTAALHGNCPDRVNHPGSNANPCSSQNNPIPRPPAATYVNALFRAPLPTLHGTDFEHYARWQCAGDHAGAAFRVCGYCRFATFATPWAQAIEDEVGNPPVNVGSVAHGNIAPGAWPGFQTRLCLKCENLEHARIRDAPMFIGVGHDPRSMDWPRNTCICRFRLRHDVMCLPHRRTRAWTHHTTVARVRRNFVDNRLQGTGIRRCDGQTTFVHHSTRAMRARNGTYRACRCGAEPVPLHTMQVSMCMGCEGIIQLQLPGPGRPLPQVRTRSMRRDLTIGRPRVPRR